MTRHKIELSLINENDCPLGTWEQEVTCDAELAPGLENWQEHVTNAVIKCLQKNHICLVAGDKITINQAG